MVFLEMLLRCSVPLCSIRIGVMCIYVLIIRILAVWRSSTFSSTFFDALPFFMLAQGVPSKAQVQAAKATVERQYWEQTQRFLSAFASNVHSLFPV